MLITGTYQNGTVRLDQEVRLKHEPVTVTVQIPDDELADRPSQAPPDPLSQVADPAVQAMIRDIRAIRQTAAGPGSGLSDSELLRSAFTRRSEEAPPHD